MFLRQHKRIDAQRVAITLKLKLPTSRNREIVLNVKKARLQEAIELFIGHLISNLISMRSVISSFDNVISL